MIIDAHTHVYDRICGVTQYGIARPLKYGLADFGANHLNRFLPPAFVDSVCPVETLIAYMDWVGVDRAVLLTQSIYGYANDYLAECVRRFPTRFVGMGSLDPLAVNSDETLEYLLHSQGLKGLKLDLGSYAGLLAIRPDFRLNDQRVLGLWKVLEKHDAILTLDFGGTYGMPGHQLAELRVVLDNCPHLKVVLSHLGYPPILDDGGTGTDQDWSQLLEFVDSFNVWLDTSIFWFSTALKGGPEEYPYRTLQGAFRTALDRLGPERILWGTDMPTVLCWSTYAQNLRWIEAEIAALTPGEQSLILSKNAAQVYGFDIDQ
jgi:predicted TIM-barrel fold metal-dependent hydrolase